jgi:hypothetical protein
MARGWRRSKLKLLLSLSVSLSAEGLQRPTSLRYHASEYHSRLPCTPLALCEQAGTDSEEDDERFVASRDSLTNDEDGEFEEIKNLGNVLDPLDSPPPSSLAAEEAQALLESFLSSGGSISEGVALEWSEDDDDEGESEADVSKRALREERQLCNAPPLRPTAPDGAASALESDGVVMLSGALTEATARGLRRHILKELSESLAAERGGGVETAVCVRTGEADDAFSAVLSPRGFFPEEQGQIAQTGERRWDLRLRLSSPVRDALRELLEGPVGEAFEGSAGGDAELYELAALVAAPGAAPQPLHADTLWDDIGCLFTSFVALQPVTRSMGPTRFLCSTHTQACHAAFDQGNGDSSFLDSLPSGAASVALLGTGDAALYDSRLLHGGSAHAGGPMTNVPSPAPEGDSANGGADEDVEEFGADVRVLFYTTFRRAVADVSALANDGAQSLRATYRGRFLLERLRQQAKLKRLFTASKKGRALPEGSQDIC